MAAIAAPLIAGCSAGSPSRSPAKSSPPSAASPGERRQEAIAALWDWFSKNAGRIRTPAPDRAVIGEIADRLQPIDEGLAFQIGPAAKEGQPYAFELSADGVPALIPVVEETVRAAPKIPGWKIVAFRQPAPGATILIRGAKVSAKDVRYQSIPNEDKVDLIVFMPGMTEVDDQESIHAGFLLLDAELGEYAVMTRLAGVDFLPMSQSHEGLRPLTELREQLGLSRDGLQGQKAQSSERSR